MKKNLRILAYILISILLTSCFWTSNNDEINKAKEEMWIVTNDSWPVNEVDNKNEWSWIWTSDTVKKEEKEEETQKTNIKIENLTQDVFLSFDDISESDLLKLKVEITWKTLTEVDKIIVKFSNNTSQYPDDNYTLQKFSAWDNTFLYRAFSEYEALDYGINEYIFEAYSENTVAKTKVTLTVKNEIEESKDDFHTTNNNYEWEKLDISSLPVWANFWEPREIWNWKITYSDIKWLNIELLSSNIYDCGQNTETWEYYVTEILNEKLDSYFWWNTCKPFWDEEWISYYVLRLDWTSFIYEKHIYLNNWIYWIYNLETWENFIEENEETQSILTKLQEKNTELKEKNDTFTIVEIVNDLFTKILNN